jgi:hypothetical protein
MPSPNSSPPRKESHFTLPNSPESSVPYYQTLDFTIVKDFIPAFERVTDLPYQTDQNGWSASEDWAVFNILRERLNCQNVNWTLFKTMLLSGESAQSPMFHLLVNSSPITPLPNWFRSVDGRRVKLRFFAHEFVILCVVIGDQYAAKRFSKNRLTDRLTELIKTLYEE